MTNIFISDKAFYNIRNNLQDMSTSKQLITFFLVFSVTNCDKKFLKVRECFTDSKISRLDRCEIINGSLYLAFDVLSPIGECMVSKFGYSYTVDTYKRNVQLQKLNMDS